MIVKAKTLRYEYFDIPEHLKEAYHEDIEKHLNIDKDGNYTPPSYHNLMMWARSKGVSLPIADV